MAGLSAFVLLYKIWWIEKCEKFLCIFLVLGLVFHVKLLYYKYQVVESGVLWSMVVAKWREMPCRTQRKGHQMSSRKKVCHDVHGRIQSYD